MVPLGREYGSRLYWVKWEGLSLCVPSRRVGCTATQVAGASQLEADPAEGARDASSAAERRQQGLGGRLGADSQVWIAGGSLGGRVAARE